MNGMLADFVEPMVNEGLYLMICWHDGVECFESN